jgi:Family of unknown function (DUF6130)
MTMTIKALGLAAAAFLIVASSTAQAQAPTQFLSILNEPEPKLNVDRPIAEPLATRGTAIIPYRTENFRILPIFGPGASDVSPRAGHLHVTVDDLPWLTISTEGCRSSHCAALATLRPSRISTIERRFGSTIIGP